MLPHQACLPELGLAMHLHLAGGSPLDDAVGDGGLHLTSPAIQDSEEATSGVVDSPTERRKTKHQMTKHRMTERWKTKHQMTERGMTECWMTECQMTEHRMTEGQKRRNDEWLNTEWTEHRKWHEFLQISFIYSCSLPLQRVHEIKRMYLAPCTHGLFITQTHPFISCIHTIIVTHICTLQSKLWRNLLLFPLLVSLCH